MGMPKGFINFEDLSCLQRKLLDTYERIKGEVSLEPPPPMKAKIWSDSYPSEDHVRLYRKCQTVFTLHS